MRKEKVIIFRDTFVCLGGTPNPNDLLYVLCFIARKWSLATFVILFCLTGAPNWPFRCLDFAHIHFLEKEKNLWIWGKLLIPQKASYSSFLLWLGIPKQNHNDLPPSRYLLYFQYHEKLCIDIIFWKCPFWWSLVDWHRFLSSLPEKWKRRTWSSWQRRPPKRFPSSKHKKTHKYIERGTNTQNANIDTLKYTNTHKYTNKQKVEATGDLKSEIPATKTQWTKEETE